MNKVSIFTSKTMRKIYNKPTTCTARKLSVNKHMEMTPMSENPTRGSVAVSVGNMILPSV